MEIKGRIIAALEPQNGVSQRTGNSWSKQEFVLETHDQYPKKCCFTVFGQDRLLSMAEVLTVGNDVTVSFDIDAREYSGRWYNSVSAWKVVLSEDVSNAGFGASGSVPASPAPAPQPVPSPTVPEIPAPKEDDEKLPF